MNIEKDRCPLCDNENLKKVNDKLRGTSVYFPLLCCNCGLIFLNKIFFTDQDELNEFYEEEYLAKYYEKNKKQISHNFINKKAYQTIRRERIDKYINQTTRVLDVGCGPGYFIDSIKGDVLNVVGIEKNIQERAYLNEQLNIICYEQISDLSPDTKFDLIVLNQVLEHVYNPVNFLRELYGLIDKNGVFVIEVPSSSNSLVSLYNNNSFRNFWFQEPHLWYFDMNTLKEVIKKTFGNECIYSLRVFQETSFVNHYEWIVHNNKSISRDQALSKEFPLACLEDDVKDELDSLFISFNEQYQELLEKNNYGDILLATVKIK